MFRTSRILFVGSLAVTLLAAMAASTSVRAGGPQGPGTICNPRKGHASRINYSQTFGVENASTSASATVVCPIDFTVDPNVLLGPSAIQIAYKARHETIDLSCTVFAAFEDGLPIHTETLTDVNNLVTSTFDFQVREPYEQFGVEYYTVECTLPPVSAAGRRSAIVTWQSGQNLLNP
jgi:hypothetical protein